MIDEKIIAGSGFTKPFPYYINSCFFEIGFSYKLLSWLENLAPWKLVEAKFYEQYEFSFFDVNLPDELALLTNQHNIEKIKKILEIKFDVVLSEKTDLTAHKLIKGQKIRLHNDFIPEQESHRFIVQLNRGWKDENGGLLILFNSKDPSDIHSAFRPIHNSCLAFEISPQSNHAVSTIHDGERFTLVYSFYRKLSNVSK